MYLIHSKTILEITVKIEIIVIIIITYYYIILYYYIIIIIIIISNSFRSSIRLLCLIKAFFLLADMLNLPGSSAQAHYRSFPQGLPCASSRERIHR